MSFTYNEYISKISLGGSWAARSYTDYLFNLYFSGKLHQHNIKEINDIANYIFSISCGYSSEVQKRKLEQYFKLVISPIKSIELDRDIYSPVNVEMLTKYMRNEELSIEYWKDQLLEISGKSHFSNLDDFISQIYQEPKVECNREYLLYNWSFPLIRKLNPEFLNCNFESDIKIINFITDMVEGKDVWKRWYLDNNAINVVDNQYFLNLPPAYWLVWNFVHDASHIFHLYYFNKPSHCTDTHWLLISESFAMFNEYRFYKMLLSEGKFILPSEFHDHYSNILIVLIVGFLERTLRLYYDFEVHFNNIKRVDFKNNYSTYGSTLFRFIDEFHGLPGFGSVYSIGRLLYASHQNKFNFLNCMDNIFGV